MGYLLAITGFLVFILMLGFALAGNFSGNEQSAGGAPQDEDEGSGNEAAGSRSRLERRGEENRS